jgi:pimeloyl-ACP methyl ester carboxylesterase
MLPPFAVAAVSGRGAAGRCIPDRRCGRRRVIERDAVVHGRRVHYRCAGSGPPLVLLHALGENSYSWGRVVPALAAAHTVIAPDLPGFGDSDPVPTAPAPQHLADATAGFLDTLAAGPATLVGNSLGGTVALHLALRHCRHVARLVLVASAGLGRYAHPLLCALTLPGYGDLTTALGRTRFGAPPRAWLRAPLLFANPSLAPPDWLAEQERLARLPSHLPTTLAALRAQMSPLGQRHVMLPALAGVQVPTLVVWGANDMVLPPAHAYGAVGRLRRGHVEIVPACGHLPQLERPERLVAVLDAFRARYACDN